MDFLILSSIIVFLSAIFQSSDASLKLLLMIHRHGDRTAIKTYPKDPYRDAKFWPDGWGELTTAGKNRMYGVGHFLRNRYKDFLTDNPREVYVRSSGANRCLETVSLILAAAYPPKGRWVWNDNLLWQPFPIQTEPRIIDGLLNPSAACPVADAELQRVRKSPEVQELNKKYSPLYDYLQRNSGANISSLIDAEQLHDTLFVEQDEGRELPEWVKTSNIMKDLKTISDLTFYYDFSTKILQKLRAGLFIKDMRMRLKYAVDQKPIPELGPLENYSGKRLFIYSSHDSMIAAVLNLLGDFNRIAPPYGSTIFFELHQLNQSTHHIKALYMNDTTSGELHPLQILGCRHDGPCLLPEFFSATDDLIPEDWNIECGNEAYSTFSKGICHVNSQDVTKIPPD